MKNIVPYQKDTGSFFFIIIFAPYYYIYLFYIVCMFVGYSVYLIKEYKILPSVRERDRTENYYFISILSVYSSCKFRI